MSDYNPDVWVVLKITTPTYTIHKVLAGWYGGFAGSDSWKLNSGITKVEQDGEFYMFYGSSGSVYRCHKDTYRMSGLTASILRGFENQLDETENDIEMLPQDTNWLEIDYGVDDGTL